MALKNLLKMKLKQRKQVKRLIWGIVAVFVLMNVIAALHAWKFTHFLNTDAQSVRPEELSFAQKFGTIVFGIENPRPENKNLPTQAFEIITLKGNKSIEAWSIKAENSKGTVVIFHGYKGEKSSMLDISDEFLKLGFSTMLVDFRGSGGSDGNQTTIGFHEANDVKACFDFLKNKGEENIVLFGTSMGAVAVMKAINDFGLQPTGIILECPFGTMYKTTCARFKAMGVPTFPMASLLMFWGGIENGFWAFSHNPISYAKGIECPVLLLYGEKDARVSKMEIDAILENLNGEKSLKTYPLAGHENYLLKYNDQWVNDVVNFTSVLTNK